jgi:hypothetical protein
MKFQISDLRSQISEILRSRNAQILKLNLSN